MENVSKLLELMETYTKTFELDRGKPPSTIEEFKEFLTQERAKRYVKNKKRALKSIRFLMKQP